MAYNGALDYLILSPFRNAAATTVLLFRATLLLSPAKHRSQVKKKYCLYVHILEVHAFYQGYIVFIFGFSGWGETESTWYVGHCWALVPAPEVRG
jgi:hypothetical protein